jgi:hypothetical protein
VSNFLHDYFNPQNIMAQLAWWLLLAILGQLLAWLFRLPMDRKKRFAFWVVIPLGMLVAIDLASFMSRTSDRPNLQVGIDIVIVGIPPQDEDSTAITLIAHVTNTGAPTIAERWSLTVVLADGQKIPARSEYIRDQLVLNRNTGPPLIYHGKDALYNKTVQAPLPKGGIATGLLFFVIKNTKKTVIYNPTTKLILTCNDAYGREYSTEKPISVISSEPMYVPGMSPQ